MTTTSDVTTSTVTLFSLTSVNFKGWYSESNGGITASFCPPNLETLVAGGPDDAFVDCCATSGCSFPASCTQCGVPTACFEGSIQVFNAKTTDTYGNTGYYTYNCWEGITMTCDSVTIFEQHAQSTDGWSKTAYWCLPGGHPTALYREYDTITTITSTATSTSTSTTPIQTSSTATLPTNTSTSTSGSGGSSSKAGPIAGGVVGGVAGVALIAGALWYFFKRRGATKEQGGMSEFGSEFVTVPQR